VVDVLAGLGGGSGTSSSLKVLSKVKVWSSTYLVMPSTLNFGSCTLICGLAQEIESISPACYSFLKMGRLRTQTESWVREVYFEFCAGDVGREQFFPELILLDHDFEVDVDHLAALGVDNLLLLLLTFGLLHLQSTLFPVLLDFLDFLKVPSLLVARLHI
jgi:hypothetical protein